MIFFLHALILQLFHSFHLFNWIPIRRRSSSFRKPWVTIFTPLSSPNAKTAFLIRKIVIAKLKSTTYADFIGTISIFIIWSFHQSRIATYRTSIFYIVLFIYMIAHPNNFSHPTVSAQRIKLVRKYRSINSELYFHTNLNHFYSWHLHNYISNLSPGMTLQRFL